MKQILSSFLILFISTLSFSQNFEISGELIDEDTQTPLESATVFAEKPADSSLITYTITGKKGDFELVGKTANKEINLNISYNGYTPFRKKITLNGDPINLGTIKIAILPEELDGVTVTANRAPITIKKDTLEFNAASFSTKKNATVEDLLKELPGVEVDAQGNIKVNGKSVNKILVNGKSFFGDDPTIATRNLTKEIVDKIQVTDTKTESEAFTGEKGDDQNKTINITIDEEKNKGYFGRVAAGAGTDKRFEYAGLINYFDNDLRISALAGGNNINSPGFSFGEIEKMFGSTRNRSFNSSGAFSIDGKSFGGGQGVTNSRTTGANYANNFIKGTEISADYFYSAADTFNEEIRDRENILPENRYFSTSNSRSESDNDTHSSNIRFKTQIDSTFMIEVVPQFTFNKNSEDFTKNEESLNLSNELINQSTIENNNNREGINFKNRLVATKKYGTKGGFVKISTNSETNTVKNEDFTNSKTEIFGNEPQSIIRHQLSDGEKTATNINITPSFRFPIIADTLFFNASYTFGHINNKDRRNVFDFNEQTQQFSDINNQQSTDFSNTNNVAKAEGGLSYKSEKIYARFNIGYLFRTLKSEDALRQIEFENNYEAIQLNAGFSYQFDKTLSLYAGYYMFNDPPNISQLSPYVDISNPLNITQGNPNLKPSNEHSVYVGINNYDYKTQSGFYSYINADISSARVVPKTVIDENFVRNTTYINVDGNYNLSASVGYNKNVKLDSIRTVKYGANFYVVSDKSVNFNNNVEYSSRTIRYYPSVELTFTWKDYFEINPGYSINFNTNSFDIDAFEDRSYTRHEFSFKTKTFFPKFLEWNNDFEYVYNADVMDGFDKSYVFWNSSLVYSFLKDSGSATLKVYDLLNQNNNVRRVSNQDYIQDIQSTVLRQYFMLTLSYKFNTLGKKGEIDDNPWD